MPGTSPAANALALLEQRQQSYMQGSRRELYNISEENSNDFSSTSKFKDVEWAFIPSQIRQNSLQNQDGSGNGYGQETIQRFQKPSSAGASG